MTLTPEDKQARFQSFLARVQEGDSLKEALATTGEHWGSITRWLSDTHNVTEDGATFAAAYARARSLSAEGFADRALAVAMGATGTAQVERLQVDTLKWRAAMADPKGYGDRKQVDTNVTVRMLPVEERDKALQRIVARATLANPLTGLGHDAPTPHSDDAP